MFSKTAQKETPNRLCILFFWVTNLILVLSSHLIPTSDTGRSQTRGAFSTCLHKRNTRLNIVVTGTTYSMCALTHLQTKLMEKSKSVSGLVYYFGVVDFFKQRTLREVAHKRYCLLVVCSKADTDKQFSPTVVCGGEECVASHSQFSAQNHLPWKFFLSLSFSPPPSQKGGIVPFIANLDVLVRLS